MNEISGIIQEIQISDQLSLVKIKAGQELIASIVIETPETNPNLKQGNHVKVVFKETEVMIGTGSVEGLSLRNKWVGKLIRIQSGELLSKVVVETSFGEVRSMITTESVRDLSLVPGMQVTAMIKTNEIMLSDV